MLPPFQLDKAINQIVQEEWGRILAALTKSTNNLQLAEDSLQDAVEIALQHWPTQGLPDSPAAWLIQTARRKAIDRMRRDANFAKLQPEISYLIDIQTKADLEDVEIIPDKRLELIFTCCHPAIEEKTRIALTLRTLGGLTTEEIARTFLDKPQTMAQRLARAKKKIAVAGIPYEVPAAEDLPERLNAVLRVIYFIFNEGYTASSGKFITRGDLAEEAIRLCRIIATLLPEQPEITGLLALMLLHDSRRFTRQNEQGEIISLEDQKRHAWDKQKIAEGTELIKLALAQHKVGPYQLQAAISALHAESPQWNKTDWPQIAALYQLLHQLQPTPVIKINQAVAVSYAQTADDALALLDSIAGSQEIQSYQPYHAARADILKRAGQHEEASIHFNKAIELTENQAEKHFLQTRKNA